MAISKEIKDMISRLYTIDNISITEIANTLGISYNTVKSTLVKSGQHKKVQNEKIAKLKNASFEKIGYDKPINERLNEVRQEVYNDILKEIYNDDRIRGFINKVLNTVDNEDEIQKELEKYGIKALVTSFGIVTDKLHKIKELEYKEKQIDNDSKLNTNLADALLEKLGIDNE